MAPRHGVHARFRLGCLAHKRGERLADALCRPSIVAKTSLSLPAVLQCSRQLGEARAPRDFQLSEEHGNCRLGGAEPVLLGQAARGSLNRPQGSPR